MSENYGPPAKCVACPPGKDEYRTEGVRDAHTLAQHPTSAAAKNINIVEAVRRAAD